MPSREHWRATKFLVDADGVVRASRDPREVGVSSRLTADRVGRFYSAEVPRHASGRLLDLGCGKAPLLGLYRDFIDDATLVDWASSLHENPHLDALADLNEPLQLGSGEYQTVVLSDVLEHIRRPHDLAREIARVMAPGAVLLMNTPFLYWLHEEPHDYFRYTRHALRDIIDSAGLEIIELRPIGGAFEVLVDISSKVAAGIPCVGRWLASAIQTIGAAICDSLPGERLSRRTEALFPLGYGLVARKPV